MTHIEKYHFDSDEEDRELKPSRSIAECGAEGLLRPCGDVDPPEYDFYTKQSAHKASCVECLQLFLKRILKIGD